MDSLASDLRQAVRALAQRPGFLAVAVLTLALGIGANSALFSVVHAVLLRPLPYQNPERLVWITHEVPAFKAEAVPGADFLEWRDQGKTLSAIAAFDSTGSVTVSGRDQPARLAGARVSTGFLSLLGVRPQHGRDFLPGEDRLSAPNTAILSARLWDRLFGANPPDAAGPVINLDGQPFTAVGVLPRGFLFPGNAEVDVLVPLALDETVERGRQQMSILQVIGRVAPGATIPGVHAELDTLRKRAMAEARAGASPPPAAGPASPRSARLQFSSPPGGDGPEMILTVAPLRDRLVGDVRPALLILLGAVGVVLLIACANVAHLLLARASARQREMAVRAALGAGRIRLVRHLLAESAVLCLAGGACGLALAAAGVRVLVTAIPPELAGGVFHQIPIGIDGAVLLFTLGLSLVTGLLFGLAPAVAASRPDLQATLKEAGQRGRSSTARQLLVAVEVALAAVLLVGAGLLLRSFLRLGAVDPGFRPGGVLTAAVDLDPARYADTARQAGFVQALTERVRALPGVEAAGFGDTVPLAGFHMLVGGPRAEGMPAQDPPRVALVAATPGYFEAMGIPLRQGRTFLESDDARGLPVAIVSEGLARAVWGRDNPVGRRFQRGSEADWITVVGVVAETRFAGLAEEPRALLYRPFAQLPLATGYLALRTTQDPASLAAAVRREVAALDATIPLHDVSTMEQRLAGSVAERRFELTLLGLFALLALTLAGVGLYGVLSYLVTERTWEIGVRMALGAGRARVLGLVIRQGLWAAALGVVAGLAAAFALSRLLASALYGVTATDPVTYVAIPAVLLAVALVASYLPARRATRVDPIEALRVE